MVREAQRTFMQQVYRWMTGGLALTGIVAMLTASSAPMLQFVASAIWILFLGQLALVFVLSGLAPRLSATAAGALFVVYAGLNGLTLSFIFVVYPLGNIANAFFVTAGAFGAMSLYGTVTKKDLSAWGTFLIMGLFGVIIASVVGYFFPSPGLSFVVSCCCVVVFAGLTAYDTQKLREMGAAAAFEGGGQGGTLAIRGALSLYLDFINLFLAFLRLMNRR
ncbi:MAG TPA: Bax inhibitor-1/YccA family protein [Myxococcaceae bacterium]|nr:Bax inhibitor-1/YccA family protein [Myxococcaceae bacterium]